MLTLFATPKPFEGHNGRIQYNALRSWRALGDAVEVLLIGDDAGVAEAAAELGFRHLPEVERNEFGTPLIPAIFALAEQHARGDFLCYINADIILFDDFLVCLRLARRRKPFLMIGQRCDLDFDGSVDTAAPDQARELRRRAKREGKLHPRSGIDYFVFRRGLWPHIPSFALGRTVWDNWLVYGARAQGADIVDASLASLVIHQNHDYNHGNKKAGPIWTGIEAQRNRSLAPHTWQHMTIEDATWYINSHGRCRPVLDPARVRRRIQTASTRHSWIRPFDGPLNRILKLGDHVLRYVPRRHSAPWPPR